jgi:large conductance mechanosensitive channel
MLNNLKAFLMRGSIIDLSVGVIIGAAFGKIVSALVDKLLMPIIGIFVGGINFKNLKFTVGDAVIGYGECLQAVFDFLIIGLALYFMLRAAGKNAGPPPLTVSEELLKEIRDELKRLSSKEA